MGNYKVHRNKVHTRKLSLIRKLNLKSVHVHGYSIWKFFNDLKWKKYWMFFDKKISHIEILEPTLDNLTMMREYNYRFVVKGFKSIIEYKDWDRIRFKQGFYSMMYASRCLGQDFMSDAIDRMLNKEPFPSSKETQDVFNRNKFIEVKDSIMEKRILEREKYKKLFDRYTFLMKRGTRILIMKGRVEILG